MADVSSYQGDGNAEEFYSLAQYLEYYTRARQRLIEIGASLHPKVISDFCCGNGDFTKNIAEAIGGIEKAILIEITPDFILKAQQNPMNARSKITILSDVLQVELSPESDLVISAFAYHHIPDESKYMFANQANQALRLDGKLLIAEVYTDDEKGFYDRVIQETVRKYGNIPGFVGWMTQVRDSTQSEFKVPKAFADDQFHAAGFTLLEEHKIWPNDDNLGKDRGAYVQLYEKKNLL